MSNNVKLRLVYYFYASGPDFINNKVNRIHFELWKRYFPLFNEIVFYISTNDDLDYGDTIFSLKKYVLNITKTSQITIINTKNDPYQRECTCFRAEIANKLKKLDGITFFGHNKNISNCKTDKQIASTLQWIVSLYYLTFNFIDEAIKAIYEERFISYGAWLSPCNQFPENNKMQINYWGKYKWMYAGTFFGVNTQMLYSFILKDNINFENVNLDNTRWFAENYLSNIMPDYMGYSHLNSWATSFNLYEEASSLLPSILKEDEYEDFMALYNNIIKIVENENWSLLHS